MDAGLGLLSKLGRRLYRARRRAVLAGGLAGLSGALLYAPFDVTILSMPFPLFAGVIYATVIAFTSLLISAFVPGLRHLVELAAVSRLLLSIVGFAIPAFGMVVINFPVLSATLVVTGLALLQAGLRLPGQPNIGPTDVTVTKRTMHSQSALETYVARGIPQDDAHAGAELRRVEFRDLGEIREVQMVIARPPMSLYAWVSAWIDDASGHMVDRMIPACLPTRRTTAQGGTLVP